MTAERRSAALTLAFITMLHGMNHTYSIFLSPLNEQMRQFFGENSISAITSFKTTYLFIYAMSNLVFGIFANRMSTRWALSLGAFLNAFAVLAYTLIGPKGIAYMHILWAIGGIGGGTYHPLANLLVTRLYTTRKGWALGITGMGASMGFTFGPLTTWFLSGTLHLHWQQVATVFGLLGLLAGLAVLLMVGKVPDYNPSVSQPVAATTGPKAPVSYGSALAIFVGFVILAVGMREICYWSILDVSDFYLNKAYGGMLSTAFYLTLLSVPGILIQPMAGAISDRVGRNRMAAIALALHGFSVALIVLSPHSTLFLAYILLGIGQAASVPTIEALIADFTTPKNRGLVFGVLVTSGLGLGALGPLLSGLLIDGLGGTLAAYQTCLYMLACLTGVAAILMAFSSKVARGLGLIKEA
jgi:MFS family permease